MADQVSISSVTTLVVELLGPPADEVLKAKFAGRHTAKSLAAARRIAAKRQTVKVPAHLMRQIWRITGGWRQPWLRGWDTNPSSDWLRIELVKDLWLYLWARDQYSSRGLLMFRGRKIAHMPSNGFVDDRQGQGAAKALGQL